VGTTRRNQTALPLSTRRDSKWASNSRQLHHLTLHGSWKRWWAGQPGEFDSRQLHPLLVTAIFIVVFLEIHPFQDGNGRLSRILTTLLLLRAGYSYVPYGSLESVVEQSKEGYYLALRQPQGTIRTDSPNWLPWVLFFLRALQQQMKRLAKKVEREKILLWAMPGLSVQIIEYAREHGRVTIGDMVTLTGTSRNTLKQHFRQLPRKGPSRHARQRSRGLVCLGIEAPRTLACASRLDKSSSALCFKMRPPTNLKCVPSEPRKPLKHQQR